MNANANQNNNVLENSEYRNQNQNAEIENAVLNDELYGSDDLKTRNQGQMVRNNYDPNNPYSGQEAGTNDEDDFLDPNDDEEDDEDHDDEDLEDESEDDFDESEEFIVDPEDDEDEDDEDDIDDDDIDEDPEKYFPETDPRML